MEDISRRNTLGEAAPTSVADFCRESIYQMRVLYFDCFAGASGDMILGAMVAAGIDPATLKSQLLLLPVQGYSIEFQLVDRSGLSATYARVQTPHEQEHRNLNDILKIIYDSRLSEQVKSNAAKIFSRLTEVEARVHNESIEQVHFHEVGALDAIIDVVGAAICFELAGIERFVSSPLHVGSGTVEMAHGRFPVPPPAVAELLKGAPIYSTEIKGELVTPTGAAIIATMCSEYGAIPKMKLQQSGYGAGTREYEKFPNALRILIGETDEAGNDETLLMIETNVDDLSPQVFGHVLERALEMGALDCYLTPVQMKKNRPGVLLSILCRPTDRESLTEMVFTETTTLGVRSYQVQRRALEREVVRVETQYGPIDVKVARLKGRLVNEMPEYAQCQKAALEFGVPLRQVERAAMLAFARMEK